LPLILAQRFYWCLAEILEYALVFLTSVLVVTFSFGVYSSYAGALAEAQYRAGFSSLTTVAMASIEHGDSSITLSLKNVTLSCHDGYFSFAAPSFSASTTLPAACDFAYVEVSGTHTFAFSSSGGSVDLEVD